MLSRLSPELVDISEIDRSVQNAPQNAVADLCAVELSGVERVFPRAVHLCANGRAVLDLGAIAQDDWPGLITAPLRGIQFRRGGHHDLTLDAMRCLAPGTEVLTPQGARAVATLVPGDQVLTRDNGFQRLIWVGRSRQAVREETQPIMISAHAMGEGFPEKALCLSASHRIMWRDTAAESLVASSEVLLPARHLLALAGVDLWRPQSGVVDYVHLQCARHEVIFAHGVCVETLLPGDQSLLSLLPGLARWVAETATPELRSMILDASDVGRTARHVPDDAAQDALLAPRLTRPRG